MKNSGGYFLIASGGLMGAFWTLFALFLPMQEAYLNWVMNPNWTWINVIGFMGSLLGIFAIQTLYQLLNSSGVLIKLAYVLSVIGVVILTSILFFEAFILKGIAVEAEEMIKLGVGFYVHPPFETINLIGGIAMTFGMSVIGYHLLQQALVKRWKVIMLMISIPLFSLVVLPPNARLVGVLLYTISFIGLGIELVRSVQPD